MANLTNETILHKTVNGLDYIQFRKLLEYPELIHRFTLKPLDFMLSREESKEAVAMTARNLGIPFSSVLRPVQTHSDHIRIIEKTDPGSPVPFEDTDGLITDQKGAALLLTFADCTPLLFYDPVRHVIANIHSGWRGTLAAIGMKAVRMMTERYGCDPSDMICCIGPHIHKCCFEVDRDVVDLFMNAYSDILIADDYISYDASRNKYFIDTLFMNRELLKTAGLKETNIIDSGICTVCRSDICHSYRADREKSGRSASLLALIDAPAE